jgi:hypothetical protein
VRSYPFSPLDLTSVSHKRSNYAEPTSFLGEEGDEEGGGKSAKGRARQTISDKRNASGVKKKKSTMNVRTAILYRKNLSTLVEESASLSFPLFVLTTLTRPFPGHPHSPSYSANLLNCYHAAASHSPTTDLFSVRVLGQLQV